MNYYHGTTDIIQIGNIVLPPCNTNIKREDKRNKLNDVIFFTPSLLSASKYANKAVKRFGGNPVVLVVDPVGEIINTVNNEYISESAVVIDKIKLS